MDPELEIVHSPVQALHLYNVSYRTLKTKSSGQNRLTKEGVKALFDQALEAENFAWFFVEREDITSTGHLPRTVAHSPK